MIADGVYLALAQYLKVAHAIAPGVDKSSSKAANIE